MCDVPYQMAKVVMYSNVKCPRLTGPRFQASGTDDNFVGLNLDFVHDAQTDHHLKMAAASIYAGNVFYVHLVLPKLISTQVELTR